MKLNKLFLSLAMAGSVAGVTTSCSDMLDKGNEYVIYTDGRELTNPADTVTSLLGILNQLQSIAVRTNLLGEVRADLVNVNSNASIDLKNLANFDANVTGDEDANKYNVPRDYYGVINNCNYYLAHADSTAGNTNRNEKYFIYEIGQVHSIRAWVYLQTVLAYGRVPLITEPVITKLQSEAQYPMVELNEVCDYFIDDLQQYYGREYPDPQTFGSDVNPKLCFFPTQVVMGDLYLWKAVANHDPEMAKKAAKCYYDYIMWDKSGKRLTTMSTQSIAWDERDLFQEKYERPSGSLSYTFGGNWGSANVEGITCIPMDSASTSGYYNELRNLYNYTYKTEVKEASISPSQSLIDLSESQEWYGYDQYRKVVKVDNAKFEDEQIEDHMLGDLRFQANYNKRKITHNATEYTQQTINKHGQQHVGIYRVTQLYLRLAEALNYAGYPRFARTILTIGPNNTVIEGEVLPYYTSDADKEFLSYFKLDNTNFISYAQSYNALLDTLDMVKGYDPFYRDAENTITMRGIHSRGSGLAFLNPNYCALATPDSTSYPFALAKQVGSKINKEDYEFPKEPTKPKEVLKPSTWDKYPRETLEQDAYVEFGGKKANYKRYQDSVSNYIKYLDVTMPAYESEYAAWSAETAEKQLKYDADTAAYNRRHEVFAESYDVWYKSAFSNASFIEKEQAIVDQAILDEQALEMAYEGNRFFDLMRRALWYNDNSKLANPIAKRNPALQGKLMNRHNWYLNWKNKIGY